MNLGRFQQGQVVTIGIATVDGDSNPVSPDAAPTAIVVDPNSVTIFSGKLAMNGGPKAFALPLLVDSEFSLGTYSVAYSYSAAGFSGSGGDTFDVIAGGDPGGRIISMSAYDRPDNRYVVTQLSSGRIVQGRNPSI